MKENDIDIVILWVDGNDPKWSAERNKYLPKNDNLIDHSTSRYRDWDVLHYLFRGIEKFAPWVRKIHFVTSGHLPSWLNVNHEKLNIVKHSDFMPEQYLPTFSSHPIELNLHRIKELSEKFIYFNDDMFILREIQSTDFFQNGLPCDHIVMEFINRCGIEHILLNDMKIINKHFNKRKITKKNFFKWFNYSKYGFKNLKKNLSLFSWKTIPGFDMIHLPAPFLKKTYYTVWEKEESELDMTCKNKFRSLTDVNQYLMRYWQLCSGEFTPYRLRYLGRCSCINNIKKTMSIAKAIESQEFSLYCVNDDLENNEEFEECKNILIKSFEKILPEKSEFEISDKN